MTEEQIDKVVRAAIRALIRDNATVLNDADAFNLIRKKILEQHKGVDYGD